MSEKNIRPVFIVAAGCQGRACQLVLGGQPVPKDSSTVFRTVPSFENITEWKKSTAPGIFPVPPELNASSMIETGLAVSGIPYAAVACHDIVVHVEMNMAGAAPSHAFLQRSNDETSGPRISRRPRPEAAP